MCRRLLVSLGQTSFLALGVIAWSISTQPFFHARLRRLFDNAAGFSVSASRKVFLARNCVQWAHNCFKNIISLPRPLLVFDMFVIVCARGRTTAILCNYPVYSLFHHNDGFSLSHDRVRITITSDYAYRRGKAFTYVDSFWLAIAYTSLLYNHYETSNLSVV